MPGGPRVAPRLHVIAALCSRLCWPESCGCCELPCTEWHTPGSWSWWAAKQNKLITRWLTVEMCCNFIALPCLGPEWSLHLAAPRRRHPVRPRRSCRRGFRSLHSWPRWSSSGAGSLWPCTRCWGYRHYRTWIDFGKSLSGAHEDMSSDPGWGNAKSTFTYMFTWIHDRWSASVQDLDTSIDSLS